MKRAFIALLLPVQFQLGAFTGLDQFGQPCSLTVTAKAGGEVMNGFTFSTSGYSYDVTTGPRLKTGSPGNLSVTANLAMNDHTACRMAYGAISANSAVNDLLKADFEIRYRGQEPLSVKMTKTSKGASGPRQSFEICTRLTK